MSAAYLQIPRGFTLIEFIVAIAVAAIMISLAIPGFTALIAANRLNTITNDWVSAINLARSEAVRTGQHVVIRKTSSEWENGWQVFVDFDRATAASKNVFDVGSDQLLRVGTALANGYSLRGNNNFQNFIRYQPDGSSNNIGSFAICKDQNLQGAKLIVVSSTGRIRLALDADHDGIPEKEDGNEMSSCMTGF